MQFDLLPLVSFVTITTFTPGPNNISSASMGIVYGYRNTLGYLGGIAAGFFVVMIVCAFLSSALLTLLPVAEPSLRWIGAGYILWLAFGMLKADYALAGSIEVYKAFTKGFVLQLINPKVAVYGLTLYSTFLAPMSKRVDYLSISAVAFAMTAFAATSTWALFGAAIKNKLIHPGFRKCINTVLALLLAFTAIALSGILPLPGEG